MDSDPDGFKKKLKKFLRGTKRKCLAGCLPVSLTGLRRPEEIDRKNGSDEHCLSG
jgi:hypothetical protein